MPGENLVKQRLAEYEKRKEKAVRMGTQYIDKLVKENLTNKMLGIATGSGRRSVFNTFIESVTMGVVGFTSWYLAAYETGDWNRYSKDSSPIERALYAKEYRRIMQGRESGAELQYRGLSERHIIRDAVDMHEFELDTIFNKYMRLN